jgi:predicted XRE-type DNA-binding protein
MKKSKPRRATSGNVFQDLGFAPEESRVLTLKAQLAALIVRVTRERQLTQKELGKIWGVPQPRVSEVLTGKLSLVSIERLIEFLGALGVEIVFRTKPPSKKAG